MPDRVYRAEIIARDPGGILRRATVEFVAGDQELAEEQAEAYADRIGKYDRVDVDAVNEIGAAR